MSATTTTPLTREQRIQAILDEAKPQLEALARKLPERAVDVPRSPRVRSHRSGIPRRRTRHGQHRSTSRPREPEKKGHIASSVTCELCQCAAKFHSYQERRLVTPHGCVRVRLRRAGRNRACQIASVEPKFKECTGDDPLGYVDSKNSRRRHDNESQQAMSATRLATLKHGGERRSENQSRNSDFDFHS
jgi:hypothetical protein